MYACPIEFILPSLSVGVGKTIEKQDDDNI